MMSNTPLRQPLRTLQEKLQLIAEGEELELTPAEALIYGVDYADEWSPDFSENKEADDGE
ncbi:hypothetical protein [Mucilaginibacter lacusdianchii]|uniref:hypothetical protein n=1 Tax=Mucilaginibacter lacusdianchii TaxID=2684211 RepID=UPI00131E6378|nr:hypothetical protein [Mucilaginibacter sp. JXJ CY 39]